MQKIEDGDASFGVFLPSNFSDALNERSILLLLLSSLYLPISQVYTEMQGHPQSL